MIKHIAPLLVLVCLLAGQSEAQTVATNIVRLSAQTRLAWSANPEPDIAGYNVQMAQGATVWRSFTTNTFIPILTLNSNAQSGSYTFAVSALNRDGIEGPPATLATNLSKPPGVVVSLRLEVRLE